MKEIKTSKGWFVVKQYSQDRGKSIAQALLDKFCGGMDGYEFICKLSEATEEDAANIVDNGIFKGFYTFDGWGESEDPRLALDCLLKSTGIDVNKGNWYLFKKI